jgi:hypothetical protein
MSHQKWTPDQQRTTPLRGALRGIRGTLSERLSETQFFGQITPISVKLLYESDLPGPPPALQRMLSGARLKNSIEQFEIDETIDVVFAREARNKSRFVLCYPSSEIICDADIQRTIWLTCQNVDEERRGQ